MKKVRVLIADDSALMRQLLSEILSQDPDIEVVGTVSDAYKARAEIKRLDPDVLTLDIEMPKMDGISFLEKVMRLRPMPVVMISAMTEKGADITMKALMLGAVDFISKPKVDIEKGLVEYGDLIREKVKTAASSSLGRSKKEAGRAASAAGSSHKQARKQGAIDIIAIGASTGGVEAIHDLLSQMPGNLPPIVITQHIPPVFSASFARRLNEQLPMSVTEASAGMKLESGKVYVAPGDQHLVVTREAGQYVARLDQRGPVNRHMPAVDVLFDSVAATAGHRAIGILLTGMGSDGALGLQKMHNLGAETIAQDKESSVVWGMPREAIELGAANYVLHLNKINQQVVKLCNAHNKIGESRGGSQANSAS